MVDIHDFLPTFVPILNLTYAAMLLSLLVNLLVFLLSKTEAHFHFVVNVVVIYLHVLMIHLIVLLIL